LAAQLNGKGKPLIKDDNALIEWAVSLIIKDYDIYYSSMTYDAN
jgi:hypothetical protein